MLLDLLCPGPGAFSIDQLLMNPVGPRPFARGRNGVVTPIRSSRMGLGKAKHHLNGKALLGERNKKNGKQKIHGNEKKVDVFAEVNNGKVTAVTAAGMQVKKVRSRQKLAETTPGITLASMQLAQADVYYYGYWVYDDLTDYYYWFPADYVIVDSSWVE